MTRKTCNNSQVGVALESVSKDECGFDHGRLRLRKTVAHQRFTRRNSKFLHIDDLYRSDSTITKLFLKINDIALNQTLNNIKRSSLPTVKNKSSTMPQHNKLLRRQTSLCDKLKSPESPSNDYSQLRRRRPTSFVNNFVDSSGDDDSNQIKPMRELRSTSKLLLAALNTPKSPQRGPGRPKRPSKGKHLPLEDRVNNTNSFKVVVKKRKIKATNSDKLTIPCLSDSEDEKNARLKKKPKRVSQLSRLNNEAENFLFPRSRDESTSADSEEEDRKSTVVNKKELVNGSTVSRFSKNFKFPHEDESRDSTSSEASYRRRKRRLTQAEAFILDNQEYYKFETVGNRLRYHGSYLPPIELNTSTTSRTPTTTSVKPSTNPFISKNNSNLASKSLKLDESTKRVKKKYNLNKLKFSFEGIPNCETWYETFHRQDIGEERYTSCCNQLSDDRKISLPYELGSIPPLNPRLCFYAYQEVKRSFLGESPCSRTAACSTPDSCSLDTTSKTDDTSTGDDTLSSTDFNTDKESMSLRSRSRRRIRPRFMSTPSKTPRKSPRQHASTLAILSNLIQSRKRKPKPSLASIQEEKEAKADYDEITKFFNLCSDDLDPIEVDPDSIDCDVHCKPSAIKALEEFVNEPVSKLWERKAVRKKRTNKTGWPKVRRSAFKKEGSHSSGSIIMTDDRNVDAKENKLNGEVEATTHRTNCVDLAKWEDAERLLSMKFHNDFQPVVRVQKLSSKITDRRKKLPSSRSKRSMPASPKSPRILRRLRDRLTT